MDSWSSLAIGQLPKCARIRNRQLSSYPRRTLALKSGRDAIQDRYTVSKSVLPPRGSTDSPVALLVTSFASNCLAARSLLNVFLRFERSGNRHCTSKRTPALVSRRRIDIVASSEHLIARCSVIPAL